MNKNALRTYDSDRPAGGVDFNAQLKKLNEETLSNPTSKSRSNSFSRGAAKTFNEANAQAAEYQSQLDSLNANVADTKQKNWIKYMKAIKALPQQMANTGINGGTTESSLVRLNAAYGGANNDVDKEVLVNRTNLQERVKAARAMAEAAKKRLGNSGGSSYVTNAYGNILNNAQQTELNSIIQRMSTMGYSDEQIQSTLQNAGF